MATSRKKEIFQNVGPAILSNACVFLFSVVEGIFVGNGAGSQALGAVNLALPFVLLAQALNAMASIGGVTITAVSGHGHTLSLCGYILFWTKNGRTSRLLMNYQLMAKGFLPPYRNRYHRSDHLKNIIKQNRKSIRRKVWYFFVP